jgi:non-specific serine/threonine protein kinase
MIGTSVQHYTVLEKVGAGGMGVVYRARDTRLGRQVVLKFLPEEACRDASRLERFRREAQAASSLNHPNICTIHDIGEHEGRPFIVMELLEGQPLGELAVQGGVPLERVIDLAVQICDALAAAHEKGIVHRDIKPDNLFVVHGKQAKILDFGLAKLARREAPLPGPADTAAPTLAQDPQLTGAGDTLGTVAYMSPEQALGREVDHRSDLFSLGAVLHELGSGQRAFPGRTNADIFDAILNRRPASSLSGPASVLQPIIDKALEKDRELRYQSATELLADLKRLRRDSSVSSVQPTAAITADSRRVVAVLPFCLHSGNDEDAFLSLALAEAVSHELSGNAELVVRPTSAVLRYDPRKVDPQRVAQELGADVVVEGSIQKMAANLRVQVQAWEAASRSTLLSVKLDGTMDDLFGLQDRSAEALSNGLGVHVDSAPHQPPTANPQAYELYLRARERLLTYDAADARRATEMLRSAVALDPGFADGWAKLSFALVNMGALFDPDRKWYVEAERATSHALDLEPENAEAWTARGRILWSPHHGFKNTEALRILHRACNHKPHPGDAPLWLSVVLAHVGLHGQAIKISQHSIENHPDDLMAMLVKGEALGWDGDTEGFHDAMMQTIHRDRSFTYSHLFLPCALLYLERFTEAEEAMKVAKGVFGSDSMLITTEALLWAKRGERERALETLAIAANNRQSVSHLHHAQHYAACTYAVLGEPLQAVEQLNAAVKAGFPNYTAFSRDSHFASLQSVDEYVQLLRKLRATWEAYQAEFGDADLSL